MLGCAINCCFSKCSMRHLRCYGFTVTKFVSKYFCVFAWREGVFSRNVPSTGEQDCEANRNKIFHINFSDADDVAQDFPDLKICIGHMAYPWAEETLGLMRKCPNVYTDISAACIRPTVLTWNLVMAKEYNMMDRTMYGSDYPCCAPRKDFIEWIKTDLNKQSEKSGWPTFTKGEIENILGNTAKEFLGL